MDSQINQLIDQITFTFNNSEFNTKKLFSEFLTNPLVIKNLHDPKHYSLGNVDAMINFIDQQRTTLGAQINRMKFAMAGDSIANENTQAMQSHGDTDFARESVQLGRNQILFLANLLMLKMQVLP